MDTCDNKFYEIEIATSGHFPDVLRIMRENFYHDEPMFKSLCLNYDNIDNDNNDEKQRINEYFDRSIKAAFESSPCIVVVRKDTSQVVGALITTLSLNPKTGSSEKKKDGLVTIFSTKTVTPPSVKTYVEYMMIMNDEMNMLERFPNARIIWEFYAVAVDKNHRKLGLAKDLMKAGTALAIKNNVSMVFGAFSSIYSRKSAEKIGMTRLMEFDLAQYKDLNGAPIFKNTEPHNIVTVMVLEL